MDTETIAAAILDKQELDERNLLIAQTTLLIHNGCIYPGHHELCFPVTDASGNTEERFVTCINFIPGWRKPLSVYFGDAFCTVEDPEDIRKVVDHIIRKYAPVELKGELDVEVLREEYNLRADNMCFISRHGDIDWRDRVMIQKIRTAFAKIHEHEGLGGEGAVPSTGDIVEGAYYHGAQPFNYGLIESYREESESGAKRLSFCAHPHIPFIYVRNDGTVRTSVSGGPFFGVSPDNLEYVGPDERFVCGWGHAGVTAQGAVDFRVKVNRWRIKDCSLI